VCLYSQKISSRQTPYNYNVSAPIRGFLGASLGRSKSPEILPEILDEGDSPRQRDINPYRAVKPLWVRVSIRVGGELAGMRHRANPRRLALYG